MSHCTSAIKCPLVHLRSLCPTLLRESARQPPLLQQPWRQRPITAAVLENPSTQLQKVTNWCHPFTNHLSHQCSQSGRRWTGDGSRLAWPKRTGCTVSRRGGHKKASFWCLIPHPASVTAGNPAADGQRPPPTHRQTNRLVLYNNKKKSYTALLSSSVMFEHSFCFCLELWSPYCQRDNSNRARFIEFEKQRPAVSGLFRCCGRNCNQTRVKHHGSHLTSPALL